MPLTSTITPYDREWPDRYREEAEKIAPVFGDALDMIHHVGSTAIPGLAAKPEIDILVVVGDVSSADVWNDELAEYGYTPGGDLSPGHLFYKRNVNGVRTHKIHVCVDGHLQINAMLGFRDHLRLHPDVRKRYETLKLKLEAENTQGIGEYLEGKASFIEKVLSMIDR